MFPIVSSNSSKHPPLNMRRHESGRRPRDLFRSRQHPVGNRAGAGARGTHSRRLAAGAGTRRSRNVSPPAEMLKVRAALLAEQPAPWRTISPSCAARLSRGSPTAVGYERDMAARGVRVVARRAQRGRAVRGSDSGTRQAARRATGSRRSATATPISRRSASRTILKSPCMPPHSDAPSPMRAPTRALARGTDAQTRGNTVCRR